MVEKKYAKYFVNKTCTPFVSPVQIQMIEDQRKAGNFLNLAPQYYINDEKVKGSFFMMNAWTVSLCGIKPVKLELAHTHNYDEILGFMGSAVNDVTELGGEIEIWLEDEQYRITKSFMVFIPKGMKHCPIIIRKVDRPFLGYAVGLAGTYSVAWQEEYKGAAEFRDIT
jgi:hypothetical protein